MGECSTQSLGLDLMRKKISEGRRKTFGIGSKVSRSEDLVQYHHLSQPWLADHPFTNICAALCRDEARYLAAAGMSTMQDCHRASFCFLVFASYLCDRTGTFFHDFSNFTDRSC